MRERLRQLTGGALALLFVMLTAAEVICALPCGRGATDAPPAEAATHCQTAATGEAPHVAPAASCGGAHSALAPAEAASRRIIAPVTAAASLFTSIDIPNPEGSLIALAARAPGSGTRPIVPPLRI